MKKFLPSIALFLLSLFFLGMGLWSNGAHDAARVKTSTALAAHGSVAFDASTPSSSVLGNLFLYFGIVAFFGAMIRLFFVEMEGERVRARNRS